MRIQKIICTSLLAISMSSMSVLAFAELTIKNNTKKDSTSIINGKCSTALPDGKGVTKAGETRTIDNITIGIACWGHLNDCTADVYMTPNCDSNHATKIATVVFHTKKGIQSVTEYDHEYQITYSPFSLQLNGGPVRD